MLSHALVFPILVTATSAVAISTTFTTQPTPLPTLFARDTSASITATTTAINFLTTSYITVAGVTNDHVTVPAKTMSFVIPTCIQTLTPDKNGYLPPGTCHANYDYYPSFALALVASALFGVLTVVHIGQAAWYKKKFCWVLIMGSIWETASFVTRTLSTENQQSTALLLVSQLFVLLAPLWINAFAYTLLAHTIHFFTPTHSLSITLPIAHHTLTPPLPITVHPWYLRSISLPAALLSMIFISLDLISFVIQLIGGSWAGPAAPEADQMKGVHIYMYGIGLQQLFIFVFVALAVKFHLEMKRSNDVKPGWKRMMWSLYVSLCCITIRILFRLIEFSAGKSESNPLPFHESYFYALEAVPMFFAIFIFNILHPGQVLVGSKEEVERVSVWGFVRGWWRARGEKREGKVGFEMNGTVGTKYRVLEE